MSSGAFESSTPKSVASLNINITPYAERKGNYALPEVFLAVLLTIQVFSNVPLVWQIVLDIYNDRSAFIFWVKQPKKKNL
jgi:hypothetical protein